VAASTRERIGVLVVRVWIEGDPATGLRARITRNLDIANLEDEVTTASSVECIEGTVRTWLAEFTSGRR
jgi:hypothetical protein